MELTHFKAIFDEKASTISHGFDSLLAILELALEYGVFKEKMWAQAPGPVVYRAIYFVCPTRIRYDKLVSFRQRMF